MTYTVELTDYNAIYVNNHRITDRSTKWGSHQTMDSFTCERKEDIRKECLDRGWYDAVQKIDENGY